MVTFSVPTHCDAADRLVFRVPARAVLLAGNRHGTLPQETAAALVHRLNQSGFGFLVGCAPGIDRCFRSAVSHNPDARETAFIACAFSGRVGENEAHGLTAGHVVPDGLSAAASLHRRTVWMVKRSVLLILFPDDPETGRWGRGSGLAFRSALLQLKPVFVVTKRRPAKSAHYRVIPDRLYGLVDGYWVVPHPTSLGTCDEEV
jgi:hypothetical protein